MLTFVGACLEIRKTSVIGENDCYFLPRVRFAGAAVCYPVKVQSAETALEAFDVCIMSLFIDVDKVVVDSGSVFCSGDYQKGLKARGVS